MIEPATVDPPGGIPPADPSSDHSIVVRVPNWIGDAVLALPAVAALAEAFRAQPLVVVARSGVAPLFAGLDRVERVVRLTGRNAFRFPQARRGLAGTAPAVGVVLPHSMGAAAELAAGGVAEIWGYGGFGRRLALDVALPRRWLRGRHRWEAYALLAASVTGRSVPERYPIPAGPGDVAAADALFQDPRLAEAPDAPRIGLFPGAHAPSRRWPPERFADLAGRLGQDGARVLLFGSAADRPLAAAIAAAARPAPLDWAGRTPLPVLAQCFRRLDFLVTNDTGPMHLAAAVGTPLLDLCGAADETVTGPRGRGSAVLVHPIHCRPCVKNACAYTLGCLRGISVDRVHGHVRERTAPRPAGAPLPL